MKNKFSITLSLVLIMIVNLVGTVSPALAAYSLIDLGTLGGSGSSAYAINEAGQVIGDSTLPGDSVQHAYFWENGVMTDLGTLGGSNSYARYINEAGWVIGNSDIAGDNAWHGFVWDPITRVMTDLDPSAGANYSSANGINEVGQIIGGSGNYAFFWENGVITYLDTLPAGSSYDPIAISEDGLVVGNYLTTEPEFHALVWEPSVGTTDLSTLLGNKTSRATAMNEAGQVIGYYWPLGDASSYHAFFWDPTTPQEITDLTWGGSPYTYPISINESGQVFFISEGHILEWDSAAGGLPIDLGALCVGCGPLTINESRQVIGQANDEDYTHGLFWEAGVSTILSLGGNNSDSVAINEAGQVIGWSYLAGDTEQHAFVWEDGLLTDLGTLGGTFSWPTAINENGWIIGFSSLAGDLSTHAFLAIFEPVTLNTPVGNNITVSPSSETTLTFASVSSPGSTTVAVSSTSPTPPSGFALGNPATYYDISTTAVYSPPVTVCITYDPSQYSSTTSLHLLHYDHSVWVDATTSNDTTNNIICGIVSSLSPFIVAQSTYNFSGFSQPVDNNPTLNVIKAGQGVPVKFSLRGNQGLNIMAAGYPISRKIACESGASLDDIEQTVTVGKSTLTYDAATDTYTYVWKTDSSWKGTCRTLVVRLSDGTEHMANFKFK